jgi:hypothetical protein
MAAHSIVDVTTRASIALPERKIDISARPASSAGTRILSADIIVTQIAAFPASANVCAMVESSPTSHRHLQ